MATRTYLHYRPMDRLGAFPLIEFGLFLAAAFVLGALVRGMLRRRPQRPHYITARQETALR